MVLSTRRRRGSRRFASPDGIGDPVAPIQFRLEAGQETYTTDDGQQLHGRGYTVCDARTGTALHEDDFFFRIGGGMVGEVVDTDAHLVDLQHPSFAPGQVLPLARHGAPALDEPALVTVMDAGRTRTAGRLAPELADAVTFYGDDSYDAALCLWEWRAASGMRVGLRVLLAPGWTVEALPTPIPS